MAKKPSDFREVSHSEAYDANMIIQNVSPYPTEAGISFDPSTGVLGILFAGGAFVAPKIVNIPMAARGSFILGVMFLLASTAPTWSKYINIYMNKMKDRLITENRSKRIRLKYWKNFYD